MLLNPFTLHTPKTLTEACLLKSQLDRVEILAGGTFLVNRLKFIKKKGLKTPENIISLKHIPDLNGIHYDAGILYIKSMTTFQQLFSSEVIAAHLPVLKALSYSLGTNQIRNMATVGGNLTCRYSWTELPAVLICLGAKLHWRTEKQDHEITAEEFFKKAAPSLGILHTISIPIDSNLRVSYVRCKKTLPLDIPLLAVCACGKPSSTKLTNVRLTVNRGSAFSSRLIDIENFIETLEIEDNFLDNVIKKIDIKNFDLQADDYKTHMYKVCINQALSEIRNPGERNKNDQIKHQ
jgi:CO/xanthine dehydrogenase FAD-binding subunit